MAWYKQLHWQIILGLILGLVYGVLAATNGLQEFTADWITPFGTIFINLLKLIAVPLVLASLIMGVASLADIRKLGRIGGKTLGLYILTTAVAIAIGLIIANLLQPGHQVPPEMRESMMATYADNVQTSKDAAATVGERGPLQILIDMVPDNIFKAGADNRNMLQVVFFAIFFGIGLLQIPKIKAQPIMDFFDGLNDVVIKLVDIIMLMAPLGVFALMSSTIVSVAGDDLGKLLQLLGALGIYCITVVGGLLIHTVVVYPAFLYGLSRFNIKKFFQAISRAQLVGFSTSSSGATLPVTMECAEEKLGASKEITSFVLPLGATINMDGTALYQGVATVFIAQALGMDLSFAAQLNVLLLAVMASIGTAAVPGAGVIMLIIILESVGVPSAGIALILGVDRILDMLRTVTNVTGDLMVCTVIAKSEGQLHEVVANPHADDVRLTAAE
ncbi:MAG: dicarboxylate/amino acid:cation symporter [Rhodothermia bacterium]|nr:dicarboxylate/amino acid:cation symporter [Rhodothermia bacterium]